MNAPTILCNYLPKDIVDYIIMDYISCDIETSSSNYLFVITELDLRYDIIFNKMFHGTGSRLESMAFLDWYASDLVKYCYRPSFLVPTGKYYCTNI